MQHLFDRRISTLTIIKNLIRLFENSDIVSGRPLDNLTLIRANIDLISLVNNSFFEPIGYKLADAVENGTCFELTQKRNELSNLASSITLIYSGIEAKRIESFVLQYEELLRSLFLFCSHFSSSKQDELLKDGSLGEYLQGQKDEDYINDLMKAYEGTKEAYFIQKKDKAFDKIKKQTKLM